MSDEDDEALYDAAEEAEVSIRSGADAESAESIVLLTEEEQPTEEQEEAERSYSIKYSSRESTGATCLANNTEI